MLGHKTSRRLAVIGPGILVAGTGVGAGDLATGAFAGSKLGVAVLWAVVLGAGLKFLLNEGLARWQLATGTTLLEGCATHFGRSVVWVFLGYLLIWSFLVGAALMSACGVTAHAICPVFDGAGKDKILYGLLHSGLALLLVRLGGYRLFGKVMGVCIGLMFVVVVSTAVVLTPSWSEVASGLARPTIPQLRDGGLAWTIALLGGVGGTVTVLSYGYWIREEGWRGTEHLRACRIDLAAGYAMTGLFGISMVIIGSQIRDVEGRSATLVVRLADRLANGPELGAAGPAAKWAFLVGAWGAVFSSMLGVCQSVPYLYADLRARMRPREVAADPPVVDTRSKAYRRYLFGLAIVPAAGLIWMDFERVQLLYAVVGALFIPMLALVLLILNGRARLVGPRAVNSWFVSLLLGGTLAIFLFAGWLQIRGKL